MKLSENFTLEEMCRSETAIRHNINNFPCNFQYMNNLALLVQHVLQPVRNYFESPVIVTSGFRSRELNEIIRGAPNSQHTYGQAADFHVLNVSNYEVARYIWETREFDQLILEHFTEETPYDGWIHCSYSNKLNRREVLHAYKDEEGKTKYDEYSF